MQRHLQRPRESWNRCSRSVERCRKTIERHLFHCISITPLLSWTGRTHPSRTWWLIYWGLKGEVWSVCLFLYLLVSDWRCECRMKREERGEGSSPSYHHQATPPPSATPRHASCLRSPYQHHAPYLFSSLLQHNPMNTWPDLGCMHSLTRALI